MEVVLNVTNTFVLQLENLRDSGGSKSYGFGSIGDLFLKGLDIL